jgi:hypothetical protein
MTGKLDDARPLPVILKPLPDELLSSWLSRHAAFYGMKRGEFVRFLLSHSPQRPRAIDLDLTPSAAGKLGFFFRRDSNQIRQMTHGDLARAARSFVAAEPIQVCSACRPSSPNLAEPSATQRCSQRGWRITCPVCRSKLSPLIASGNDGRQAVRVEPRLWNEAAEGEHALDQFLSANEETATAAVAAFRMLLVPRPRRPAIDPERNCRLHAVDALLPNDDMVERFVQWANRAIPPLQARPRLLAGFRRLLEKPRPRFHILRSVTLGNYRLRLEMLGQQASPILGPLWFS